MKKISLFAALCCITMAQAETTYNSGVFILNEDWYGHNNSTINHLSTTGQFTYRILQAANQDTHFSLGCTSQFGAIYGDRFYIISKQEQDPGEGSNSQWRGGRVVVADAKTLKVIYSIPTIFELNGNSAADGRAFVGVDETKGYIGTSNGIFVLDLTTGKIGKRIAGTENPLITGNEQNSDGTGPLYNNQIGIMLRAYDYVFAIQQDKGIHIINPETDEIITTIAGCFSTMVQSKDGRIWAARNTNPEALTYPYGFSGELWQGNELLCIDPITLRQSSVNIAQLSGNADLIVEQTWYAWTAGSLCAAPQENVLYFTFSDDIWDWYNGRTHIYRYDIDNNSITEIFDTSTLGDYYIYNSGTLRVSPHGGNLYVGCFRNNISVNDWAFFQITPQGERVGAYTPIRNYWYPALFIFPDVFKPKVTNFTPATVNGGQTIALPLKGMATDKDNMDVAITKRVLSVSDPSALSAVVRRDTLFVTALANVEQSASVTVRFNSNGQTVDKTLSVNIQYTPTALTEPDAAVSLHTEGNLLFVSGITQPAMVSVFDMTGRVVSATYATGDISLSLPQGVYIVRIGTRTHRIIIQ